MEEENPQGVIYVIKPLNGDEILSITPPGIAADKHGNLLARVDGFIFVESATIVYDTATDMYVETEPCKVHMGNMVAITGNFVDYQYSLDQFLAASRSCVFSSLTEEEAIAIVEFVKNLK